jgi:THO complex subunit 1
MSVVLLGDIFDALTLDYCEILSAFVENGVNTWTQEMFFGACKNNLHRMWLSWINCSKYVPI